MEIADQYRVVLTPDEELGWVGCSVELPNVHGDGETPDKCVDETREALRAAVATMLEAGQEPPAPAEQQKRTVQVNLRLTPDERLAFEESARQLGFANLSDYLRAAGAARGRLWQGTKTTSHPTGEPADAERLMGAILGGETSGGARPRPPPLPKRPQTRRPPSRP